MPSPNPAQTTNARPATRDWIRGWVTVLGVVGGAIGAILLFASSVACGCTRPPA